MSADHGDLHGNVPDNSRVALLLIDVINDFEFEGAEEMFDAALAAAKQIRKLKQRAKEQRIPVIYANDNFGRWQSNFDALVEHCLNDGARGRSIGEQIAPEPDDYFVLKPSYSAFFATPLDLLLQALKTNTLILAGFAGNMCILFTANDAFMRNLALVIPADCTASQSPAATEYTLRHVTQVLNADISPSIELDFERLKAQAASR